jgi:hypothetical protein
VVASLDHIEFETEALRVFNETIATDERVTACCFRCRVA